MTRRRGRSAVTLRGPETRATPIDCLEGEWLGVRFKLGTFMPLLPVARLIDRQDVTLPSADERSFWLDDRAWELPSFENAEDLVSGLAKNAVIARDSAIEATLLGDRGALSLRSRQRHFLQATGMTHGTFRQIERARHATNLLKRGVSIADTAHEAGFFDQAHLTRALKRLIGQTPARIARGEEQLSFLYKTARSG